MSYPSSPDDERPTLNECIRDEVELAGLDFSDDPDEGRRYWEDEA